MLPRPLLTQLAVAAFLAASLSDPAAFAQTPLPQTPAAIAPVRPLGPNIDVVNGQIVAAPDPRATSNYQPTTLYAPQTVVSPPQNGPQVGGVNFATASVALVALIRNAAQKAADSPGYDKLTAAQKSAAVQASIADALARSGATADMLAPALTVAVDQKIIKPEDATALAWTVSAELGQKVGGAMFNRTYLGPQNTLITASITNSNNPVISVLTSLLAFQGQPVATPIIPATYDACAGVIAAYCG